MSEKDFEATPLSADIHYGTVASHVARPPHAAGHSSSGGVEQPRSEAINDPVPVAVLVCHGMGQQVRFETVGQLAAVILKEAVAQGCTQTATGVELSFQNESLLARAELNWTTPAGERHCVHAYEAYWAPITEGKVTYRDTLLFLFAAAWAGIRNSRFLRRSTFRRYLFGGLQDLTIYPGTKTALVALGLVLAGQVVAIAVVLAKLADQLKQIEIAHFALKQIFILFLPGIHTLLDRALPGAQRVHSLLALLGWYLLVAEVMIVRSFLIQYAGDVAAYISPYKASKFDDIRTHIQAVGLNVAKVIYGFGNMTVVPDYERVVIVGHSLGSVLAYDTLNAVINLDRTTSTPPGSRRVAERTTKLVTFGSPLDKTAFLFRNQSNHIEDPLREQMAAAFQPLILEYGPVRRPGFWTNLYSPMDVISGELNYYDDPKVCAADCRHVHNIRDPDANVPFYAHVQYWTNPLLAKTLYDAVK